MNSSSQPYIEKVNVLYTSVAQLSVKDKRQIFLLMRTAGDTLTPDTFFPQQGFTAGEFAVGQVLAEHVRPLRLQDYPALIQK